MDKNVKDEWVKRLRSGDYKQGTGQLRNTGENSYCCLGVLCEIAVEAGIVKVDTEPDSNTAVYYDNDADRQDMTLPDTVQEWAGTNSPNPPVNERETVNGPRASLAELNDGGYTFEQIASIIEEEL